MSPIVICRPADAQGVDTTSGTGGVNLLTDNPKEAWISGSAAEVAAILDLGSVQEIDFVYLGSVNGVVGTTWSVTYSTASASGIGATALGTTVAVMPRKRRGLMHLLTVLDAPVSARYIRVIVNQGDGGPNLTAGILRAGLSFRPQWGQEWGGGRAVVDTGTRERLPDGGFGVDLGARKSVFQWTFADLSEDEREELYAFTEDVGETVPFVMVEDVGDGVPATNEGTHWCTFDRLDYYERRAPGSSRWAFRIEQWI
ncbi:discoidin domain-containing protein [Sphingomonas sp. SRS2]|uniref:discoidin domain-containing protein n=1 Tax=Sphingomonas sp. SRS2 TaxID=133190 RepID=UPI0006184245|nr:discoidin domain-containing protein [Sphingomonas sp. SRS2]KKC27449.1 hypothetical protein WP12_03485 [Sphingomonas sp. SRS2]